MATTGSRLTLNIKLQFRTKVEELQMYRSASIKDLKERVHRKYNILPRDQIIIFQGGPVENYEILGTLGTIYFPEENSADDTLYLSLIVNDQRQI